MGSSSRPAVCGAFIAALFAAVQPVIAAELSYGGYVGMGHTDNVTRVDTNEQDETIAAVGGQLRLDHESRKVTANIATRLEYRDYLDNTYDSEVVGNFVGNAVFDFVEERFTWTVDDTFGQTAVNQFTPVTPVNSENVNYFSTGPDFTLPLGSRNWLNIHGRYVDTYYEESALGNERVRGEVALRRDLTEASNVSLNATSEKTTFDEEVGYADYDHDKVFLSYELDSARTSLVVDGGVTEISSGDQTDDGWLGRLELTRRVSDSLTVGLELGHDFSNAGNAFVEQQALQPGSLDPVYVQQLATPFENTYGTMLIRFSRNRTGMRLHVGYYDEQYPAQAEFDRKRLSFDLHAERDMSSVLSAHVGINYSRQEYVALDREFGDLTASLGMRWNFGRATFLSADYQFLDRNDDVAGADYRANELWLRVAYLVGDTANGGSSSRGL